VRILFVAQRYGHEVAGGAERHCREFATRLAGRGHEVDVVSTCAVDYLTWANVYPEGISELEGVTVHRLGVAEERREHFFRALNARAAFGQAPLVVQEAWMRSQGPYIPQLASWLAARASSYDVVVFFTYLYYTTWAGLPAVAGRVPTVLHPTAHDEPSFYVDLFDTTFRHPDAFAFSTEEESALVTGRAGGAVAGEVIGVGVDLDAGPVDVEGFRGACGVGDRPYLLFVGRVEGGKGSEEMSRFFAAYKERHPGPLALVVVGYVADALPAHRDVIVTGFVDEADKQAAYAGAVALLQPSFYESFSMVLTEAWAHRRPALVQGHCAVLEGQARRSGGGLPYRGYAEFEAAVEWLVSEPDLARALGEAGRRYAERHYAWPVVMDRYEHFLGRVVGLGSGRR
jgi:glycosyltransferase involved in cell wall biosynthesis